MTNDDTTPEAPAEEVVQESAPAPEPVEAVAPDAAEAPAEAPAEERPGLFEVSVEGAPASVEPQPSVIAMQPDSEEDLARAAAAQDKVEAASAPEVVRGGVTVESTGVPVLDRTNDEIEAGRRKVQEHESAAVLRDAKEGSDTPEGAAVAEATEQNKDL